MRTFVSCVFHTLYLEANTADTWNVALDLDKFFL